MRTRFYLLLAMPLVLASCGGDDTEDVILTDEALELPATPPVVTEPTFERPVPVILQTLNESGVGGQAIVADHEGATQLTANLTGVEPGETVMGHVHRGTCESMQQELSSMGEFGPITTGADGAVIATLAVPLQELNSGEYAIGFHHGEGTPHIACADFHATPPTTTG